MLSSIILSLVVNVSPVPSADVNPLTVKQVGKSRNGGVRIGKSRNGGVRIGKSRNGGVRINIDTSTISDITIQHD